MFKYLLTAPIKGWFLLKRAKLVDREKIIIEETPLPEPRDDEVLVNKGDWYLNR